MIRDDLEGLEKEIKRLLDDNRKFLERVLDDDFEPEPDEAVEEDEQEVTEEL